MAKNNTLTFEIPGDDAFARIIELDDLAPQPLEIPGWKMTFMVRGLTRQEIRDAPDDREENEAHNWALAVVEPKFTVEQAREIIAKKSFRETQLVLTTILQRSGIIVE